MDDEVVAVLTPRGRLTVAPHAHLVPGELTVPARRLDAEWSASSTGAVKVFRVGILDGIRLPAAIETPGVGCTIHLAHLFVEAEYYPVHVARVAERQQLISWLYP